MLRRGIRVWPAELCIETSKTARAYVSREGFFSPRQTNVHYLCVDRVTTAVGARTYVCYHRASNEDNEDNDYRETDRIRAPATHARGLSFSFASTKRCLTFVFFSSCLFKNNRIDEQCSRPIRTRRRRKKYLLAINIDRGYF